MEQFLTDDDLLGLLEELDQEDAEIEELEFEMEMEVIVTTKINMSDPFSNCAKELKEAYMRLYSFDYEKACCNRGDFDFAALD